MLSLVFQICQNSYLGAIQTYAKDLAGSSFQETYKKMKVTVGKIFKHFSVASSECSVKLIASLSHMITINVDVIFPFARENNRFLTDTSEYICTESSA